MSHTFRLKAPRVPKPREKDIAQQFKDYLLARGWVPLRQQSGLFLTPDGRYVTIGEPGLPDYVAMHARYPAFFLETKRPKGVLSDSQIRKRWVLENSYGLAVCVADNLEKLKLWLEDHERRN